MNILGVIPARYASTRFPGKPLVQIDGKSMIQRVYEQAAQANSLTDLVVATDDTRIEQHVKSFGGNVVMTAAHHRNGTERCAEVVEQRGKTVDAVINIQGDEPYIHPEQIDQLAQLLQQQDVQIATLVKKIEQYAALVSTHTAKVVFNQQGRALYFSRQPIPGSTAGIDENSWQQHIYYKHLGLYGYMASVLQQLIQLPPSPLEQIEQLEQLRWLENGYAIHVAQTPHESPSIDTPEDLEALSTNKR